MDAGLQLHKIGYIFQIVILGDGLGSNHYHNFIRENNLKCIKFLGKIKYEFVPQIISKCHVGLAPYTQELNGERAEIASPLKILEYLSVGLPVITTENGNRQNLVDISTGQVVKDDSISLARAMAFYLDHEDEVFRQGALARIKSENCYGWDKHCKMILGKIHL